MRQIMEGLKNTKIPYTCPHGRPTMIRMSKKEIEKRFKRR
jgi:DNA mismatch repair protein MutL